MTKRIIMGEEARSKLIDGALKLSDAVATTLGPRGQNVILYKRGEMPVITKDGVSVARVVELEDDLENAGAEILRQASVATNDRSGDGTTTASVIAGAILRESRRHIAAGVPPIEIQRGIMSAAKKVDDRLVEMSRPVSSEEEIAHIAKVSANGSDEIGNLVAKAVAAAGKDGAVTIEESRSLETVLDVEEGFQFDGGYVSSQFVTDERRGAVQYEDPLFLITDARLDSIDEVLPLLEVAARDGRPLIIIAEEVEGQLLAALIMNRMRGQMKIAAVKAPMYGEERRNTLEDLALTTGATLISSGSGIRLDQVKLEHLGGAKSIEILKNHTTIAAGRGDVDSVDKRIELLRAQIQQTESLHEAARIQDRVTRLASGISIIKVGGATEVEVTEKKHRVEDALEAVRSAQEEGVVAGGGIALLRCLVGLNYTTSNPYELAGAQILVKACESPFRKILDNAGVSADVIFEKLATVFQQNPDSSIGYSVLENKFQDMFKIGVIDPVKVTRSALANAASSAGVLLTTNCAVIRKTNDR
jgi:chaperonin GroEL